MKSYYLISIALIPILLGGCSATQSISDVAMGAGGGAMADYFSNGNPAITAAGAAGGVAVSEGVGYLAKKEQTTSYQNGYDKGRSDAVKQQYWILIQQQQTPRIPAENVSLYAIPLPEQTIDGVTLEPTTKYLRIEN